MEPSILKFKLTGISYAEFNAEFQATWAELQKELDAGDPELLEALKQRQIPADEVAGKTSSEMLTLERGAAGLTGLEEVIIHVASGIALKLFEEFILPKLRRSKNTEAIQPL